MERTSTEEQALRRFTLPVRMPDKTCFFAGQKLTKSNAESVRERLPHALETLISAGVDTFISGGYPGFELDAAEDVLSLKKRHPQLRLFFMLPYPNYTAAWKDPEEANRLRQLLDKSDAHMYASKKSNSSRNRIICLTYYTAHGLSALQNNRQHPAAQAAYYAIRSGAVVKNLVESSTLLDSFIERENAFRRVINSHHL